MTRHNYTDEEMKFLRENIKGCSSKELVEKFNKYFGLNLKATQIIPKVYSMGLKSGIDARIKPGERRGISGEFKKGHIPHNKGKKGTGGWEPTQFEKGHMPNNHRPVGSERTDKDGYLYIKVAEPNKWKFKHRVIWEKVNGAIPKNHALLFIDGNRQNCIIENLTLITRRQLLLLNRKKLLQKDEQINRSALLLTDVLIKCDEKRKEAAN